MMTFRDLTLRLRALLSPSQVDRDLHDELSFHIERDARKLIDEGMPPNQARATAQARFGSPAVVADECRDERGTALVDNTVRDVRFALRSFRRAPLTAFTIVTTVAIGLGVVAVLFTILNRFLFRADAVPDISEMYGVERSRLANGDQPPFTRPAFDALRRESAVFTDAYAAVHDIDLRVDGRMMAATLVTGNFFSVVRVNPVMGRALAPTDDESGGNRVIVLSDKGWNRHFNRESNVLGRTVVVAGTPFEIIGVMPAGFRGLEVSAPDFWAPLAQLAQFQPAHRGREDSAGVAITGRLKPGLSMAGARAQIAAWDSNQQRAATDGLPRASGSESKGRAGTIVLVPRRGTLPQPMEAVAIFTPLFFAFGLILMIGCANVANLLLARGVARQREIGMRLSLGASRRRIIRQLLTESWLLALAAAGGGYLISRVALGSIVYWVARTIPVDLGDPNIDINVPAADWRVAVFLVIAAMAATAFFALMPALQATRLDPVRTLRGELVKSARPGRARNVLIGIQVFASALLLILAAIFLRSAIASSHFDPGFRTVDTMIIQIVNEPKRTAMVEAIASEPTVTTYAAVRPGVLTWPDAGVAAVGASRTAILYKFVSPEYFEAFDIPIVRGRSFTPAERDGEHPVVIVSESTARKLWPNGNGVGETFRLEPHLDSDTRPAPSGVNGPEDDPPMPPRLVTVVGVSRDVAGFRIIDTKEAGIFLPISVKAAKTAVVVRVNGDSALVHRTLIDHLTRVDPNMGMIVTMRTLARLETFFLQIAFWVSLVLGGLALLLTVSGLFSVLSYLVEQRTREIGVRMALGASSEKVTRLILAQTTRPVVCGLLAGVGLAASLATILIAMPAGSTIAEIVRVTDPIAYVASLLVIGAACVLAAWIPARRAALLDPMQTLREE
jgi:putative ABC transport system permease protein